MAVKPQPVASAAERVSERAAHPLCLGREPLFQELDRVLFEQAQHFVVLSGMPGRGKSALIAAYIDRLEKEGAERPRAGLLSRFFGGKRKPAAPRRFAYHFLSGREPRTGHPDEVARSLTAQLEALFPEQKDPQDAATEPAPRLAELLGRVCEQVLAPQEQRLVLILDGFDGAAAAEAENPLSRILPETLPASVSVLCTTRPQEPHLPWLLKRNPLHLDLDGPGFMGQNAAAVHASWTHHGAALQPPLAEGLVQELAARAEGNLLHAAMAQALLAALPPARRTSDEIPPGLSALCRRAFNILASHPESESLLRGLSLLCALQAPLPSTQLAQLLGGEAALASFLRTAQPLLLGRAEPREPIFLHDAVRALLVEEIGGGEQRPLAALHLRLAAELCPWPLPAALAQDTAARHYALRYGLLHRILGDDEAGATALARDVGYLAEAARALGAAGLLELFSQAALAAAKVRRDGSLHRELLELYRAVMREQLWLRRYPEALPSLLYNRLICLGRSPERLAKELTWPGGLPRLRLRFPLQQDGSACERTIVCRSGSGAEGGPAGSGLHACAVLPDSRGGQRLLIGDGEGRVELWLLLPGAERPLWSQPGHEGPVHAALMLPAGEGAELLLTAGGDGMIKLWDLARGQEKQSWRSSAGAVQALAVLPMSALGASGPAGAGSLLAVGADDGTLCLFELATRKLLRTLAPEGGPVKACAALADGRLAIGSEDGAIRIWDLGRQASGGPAVMETLRGHTRAVSDLLALPGAPAGDGGSRLVSASLDGTLRVWQLQAAPLPSRLVHTLQGHDEGISACALVPMAGGQALPRLVSASFDGTLRLWDLTSGALLGVLEGHAGWVTACAGIGRTLGSGGAGDDKAEEAQVVSLSLDGTLKLWSPSQAQRLHERRGHQGFVTALALSPDGKRLISASRDHTLKIWDLLSGRHLHTLSGHAAAVDECAALPDNRRVVSASHDATLKIWDLESGQALTTLRGHSSWVSSCAPLPDGERMVSTALDGTLRVWNTRTGQALHSLVGHTDSITACAVLPDGERVVSASADGTLRVWQLRSGEQLATLHGHTASVDRCAVVAAADGPQVLSASADGTLKLWDPRDGRLLRTFDGHRAWISACAVLPDGRHVVSAAGDETLKVWELASGKVSAELVGHQAAIYNCAALADGRRVVSSSGDGTLKVFDVKSGECLGTVYGSEGAGFFAVITSGSFVFAGDMVGNVWMLECGEP